MLGRTLEPEVDDRPAAAARYAAMDHASVNQAFVDRLVELGVHGSTLDLGTGPADIPIRLARRLHGVAVTAVDRSGSMLELARQRVAEAGLDRRVSLGRQDVKALAYPKGSFDAVFSNSVLHHLAEPIAMLREAVRVLDSRGVLLVRDLIRPGTDEQVEALVSAHGGEQAADQQLLRQSLHAALRPKELRALADEAGLANAELTIDSDRRMSLQRRAR